MKYWMLLIFFLLLTFNLQADTATLLLDYQGVLSKMQTSSLTTLGFINNGSTSMDVMDIQLVDKRYFSVVAFFFLLIIGVLYLQYKENRLSKLTMDR